MQKYALSKIILRKLKFGEVIVDFNSFTKKNSPLSFSWWKSAHLMTERYGASLYAQALGIFHCMS